MITEVPSVQRRDSRIGGSSFGVLVQRCALPAPCFRADSSHLWSCPLHFSLPELLAFSANRSARAVTVPTSGYGPAWTSLITCNAPCGNLHLSSSPSCWRAWAALEFLPRQKDASLLAVNLAWGWLSSEIVWPNTFSHTATDNHSLTSRLPPPGNTVHCIGGLLFFSSAAL